MNIRASVYSKKAVLRGVIPLLYRIWRSMPVLTVVWLLLPLLLGALIVPMYTAQKQLIDLFALEIGRLEWTELFVMAVHPLVLLVGAALLRVVLTFWQHIADTAFRQRAAVCIQSEVYARAVAVPLARMDNSGYYDRLQRAKSVAGEDLFGVLQNAISVIRLFCELFGLLVVVSLAGPLAAVLLVIVFAVSFWIRLEADFVKRRLNRDLTTAGRQADYLREAIVKPETIRDIRIAGSIDYLLDKWKGVMDRSVTVRGNANRREIRRGTIVSAVQITGLFVMIVWMAMEMKAGGITAGTFVIVFQAMRQAHGISGRAAWPVGKIYIQGGKIIDLCEFLNEPVHTDDNTEPFDKSAAGTRAQEDARASAGIQTKQDCRSSIPEPVLSLPGPLGRIALEKVTYTYEGANEPTLHEIDLTLAPGETVALVGENGAGKSTLVKLLLGLYRPSGGTIAWDGVHYERLNPAHLRRAMSAVFQDFVRYETTLRDNVAFGLANEACSDTALRRALQAAGAEGLEDPGGGLDTRVGLVSEGGRNLSGGQWQRLAIARAAMPEARLLVLDEPTAALDPQHETELYRSFRELAQGRTVLFVSHRLGWARFADRIVVMRGGRIVEQGDHETLIAEGGAYAAMFQAQAEWYRDRRHFPEANRCGEHE